MMTIVRLSVSTCDDDCSLVHVMMIVRLSVSTCDDCSSVR